MATSPDTMVSLPVRSFVLLLNSVKTESVALPFPDSGETFIQESLVIALHASIEFEACKLRDFVSPALTKLKLDAETERLPPD